MEEIGFPIGMRIPGRIGSEGLAAVAAWAKGVELDALDLGAASVADVPLVTNQGLRVGSVDAVGTGDILSRDPARRQKGTLALTEQITRVAATGCKVLFICLIPGERGIDREEGYRIWSEAFPPIVEHAQANGVSFAMEGYPGGPPLYPCVGYTPEVLRRMFAHCPSPSLGLCYDPSHLVRLGIDHLRFLDEFASRVRHCHGKDTEILPEGRYLYGHLPALFDRPPAYSDGSWRYCIPGDGVVDWARVAFRLREAGYPGVISIELEDARYHGSLEAERAGIRRALAHLRLRS